MSVDKTIRLIDDQMQSGSIYDAFQIFKSKFSRLSSASQTCEIDKICDMFISKCLDTENFQVAAESAKLLVGYYKTNSVCVSKHRIERIVGVFNKFPTNCVASKYTFSQAAFAWLYSGVTICSQDETEESDQTNTYEKIEISDEKCDCVGDYAIPLHLAVSKHYMAEKEFGRAQGHLLLTNKSQELCVLIKEWQNYVYKSEKNLLVLRCTLILLAKNKVNMADEFIRNMGFDLEDNSTPQEVFLAYFLTQAATAKNYEFFILCTQKYKLILRRDPAFEKCISACEKTVLQKNHNRNHSMMSMFTSLLSNNPSELC